MRRRRSLTAWLLLALWLPATLHCALETAGVDIAFLCHDHDANESPAEHCADDSCHALEGSALAAFTFTKLVGATIFSVVALLPEPIEVPSASVRPERTDVPRELQRSWQFYTRAAPPSRAPSVGVS